MKERIYKHIGMTIIGAIIWVVTIGLVIINKLELLPNAHAMSTVEVVAFMMLGYIFFVGKTSLLNGLSLGVFKKIGWVKDE